MKLESRMSLGYIKGRYWVPDERYQAYSQSESFKALVRACSKAGFSFTCEYSYVAGIYTAEVITMERFEKSRNVYVIKRGNAYAGNPLHAITTAIRAYEGSTDLVRVCCLEIECMLLAEALVEARLREEREARVLGKLSAAIDQLGAALGLIVVPYECENCIGMIEHGCYCQAMGAPAPGVPPVTVQDRLERTRREAMQYDEDDDL